MNDAGSIEAPLRLEVSVATSSSTDLVAAVAALLVLERVAPFAAVRLSSPDSGRAASRADGIVAASTDAYGVLVDGGGPDVERSWVTSGVEPRTSVTEDDMGRWFRSDDDGQRAELSDLSPWALTGVAIDAPRFHASSTAGLVLSELLKSIAEGATVVEERRQVALSWGRSEVDRVLAEVARREPARIRRWLSELHLDFAHVRSAHDALRNRYDDDLGLVAGSARG